MKGDANTFLLWSQCFGIGVLGLRVLEFGQTIVLWNLCSFTSAGSVNQARPLPLTHSTSPSLIVLFGPFPH